MEVSLKAGLSPTAHTVYINGLTLVFSYETVVAFASIETGWVVSENVWSKTTGKHITQETPPGILRTPNPLFQEKLKQVLEGLS